jgi:hypothetical protein
MLRENRLKAVAELMLDHISLGGIELFFHETELCEEDFMVIEPQDFDGRIFGLRGIDSKESDLCRGSMCFLEIQYF